MKYLVLTIRKPGFDDAVRPDHSAFLQSLRDRDILEQAGPFTDRSGGAYVIRTGSLKQAQALAEQDPLHVRNCSTVTVLEWEAS
jgi:uncharacterized protein YciI